MSRGRPSNSSRTDSKGKINGSENEQVMNQMWHGLVDTLRLLPTVSPSSKPNSDEERQHQLRQLTDEKATLDQALEKLSVLIALRKGESVPPELLPLGLPSVSVSTPGSVSMGTPGGSSSAGLGGAGTKRKRRMSVSHSPAPMSLTAKDASMPSPLPIALSGGAGGRGATPGTRESARMGTPGTSDGRDANKNRRDALQDQLPLRPGRKVAFKVPKPKGEVDDGSDDWILATIVRSLSQDKARYEVQDDDDSTNTFNTTLRSIMPLPDPSAPAQSSANPSNVDEFPSGSTVLGLYPDTTSFYRATVLSAPLPGPGGGMGMRGNFKPDPQARPGVYRLMFVDDNGQVHEVQKEFVVAFPS